MKRSALVLSVLTAAAAPLAAQSPAEVIEAAVAATPARFPGTATLIRWTPDHRHEVVREGTGVLVCYDRSDERGRAAFAAQCTHTANLERVAQNRRFRAASADADGENALIDAAEADGTRVPPMYGSLWFRMDGTSAETARLHGTIAMPGATAAALGLPEDGSAGGAWLMDGGTSSAHIMIPGR